MYQHTCTFRPKKLLALKIAVARAKNVGVYPYYRIAQCGNRPRARFGAQEVLSFASSDYLGLASDPRVKEAASHAVSTFGTGMGGSAMVCGYTDLHCELEGSLAKFVGRESCMLFPSGYHANVGALPALAGRRDTVVCDRRVHASLVDGAILSGARLKRFHHNDVRHLHNILRGDCARHRMVVVDGVYSMEGDVAPVQEILTVCKSAKAFLVVDDSHGFGVLGSNGRGTCAEVGCIDSVGLISVAMSKSLATAGGCVLGDRETVEYLRHAARAAIFSASMPAANVAAALAALRIIETEDWRRQHVISLANTLRCGVCDAGLVPLGSETPIVSFHVGGTIQTITFADELFKAGLFAVPVFPPAVATGHEMIRMHVTAAHTLYDIQEAIDVIKRCHARRVRQTSAPSGS